MYTQELHCAGTNTQFSNIRIFMSTLFTENQIFNVKLSAILKIFIWYACYAISDISYKSFFIYLWDGMINSTFSISFNDTFYGDCTWHRLHEL